MSHRTMLASAIVGVVLAVGAGAAAAQQKSERPAAETAPRPPVQPNVAGQPPAADPEFCPVESGMKQMFSVMGAMSGVMQQATKAALPTTPDGKGAN